MSPDDQIGRDLVIAELADAEARLVERLAELEATRRQLIDLIVDLTIDVERWRSFAQGQFLGRVNAEAARDRAYTRIRKDAAA